MFPANNVHLQTIELAYVSACVGLGLGNGQFQSASLYPSGTGPVGVAAGDFNGGGSLDLAVVNSRANTVSILLDHGGLFLGALRDSAPARGAGRSSPRGAGRRR
jgi:hypothetical protein